MAQIRLRGIAWDHTRGMLPLLATAQRYRELHPTVQIEWHTRSLQAFGDQPIEQLAGQFDLLVIDHPFVGYAARHPVLLPLDRWLPAAFLADQAAGSVGASYASYEMGGHLWALPIDAATPVSAWREDLLDAPPARWSEVLHLARRGHVALPAIPIDSLMHFFMLCTALGAGLAADPEVFVPHERGAAALERLVPGDMQGLPDAQPDRHLRGARGRRPSGVLPVCLRLLQLRPRRLRPPPPALRRAGRPR